MDATKYLLLVLDGLKEVNLEAILIGNAAAAMPGAPITTIGLDFYYRDTNTSGAKSLPNPSLRSPRFTG